jgi:hypothetical protein
MVQFRYVMNKKIKKAICLAKIIFHDPKKVQKFLCIKWLSAL